MTTPTEREYRVVVLEDDGRMASTYGNFPSDNDLVRHVLASARCMHGDKAVLQQRARPVDPPWVTVDEHGRDIRREIAYVMDHGQSPEADAARVLQRFMCCQAGQDLVEHGLLRPFGYTFEPGRVVSANRQLRDELQHWEAILAGEAHELHDHPERADAIADMLGTVCESMRRLLKTTEAM